MPCIFTALREPFYLKKYNFEILILRIMKRLLLVFASLAFAFACTKDPSELSGRGEDSSGAVISGNPQVAAKGTLAVKLSPEAAAAVVAKQTRSEGVATRSGVEDIDAVLEEIGATRFERLWAYDPDWEERYATTGINLWYTVYFDPNTDVAQVGQQLARRAGIEAIQFPVDPKYRRVMREGPVRPYFIEDDTETDFPTRAATAMNDPMLGKQWHYDNPGTGSRSKAGADINLTDAWSLCAGNSNVIVAVIDEPIYTEHPDLKDNMWINTNDPTKNGLHGYNFYNKSPELDWKSYYNDPKYGIEYADHGSHVAGVIAAVNNNGIGVSSIAGGKSGQGVKLMSCQIMGYSDKNTDKYADSRAFEYALKNGAVIAQNSWGYGYDESFTPSDLEQIWTSGSDRTISLLKTAINTFIKFAGTDNPASPIQGGLVIFAAGNDGDLYRDAKIYPAADENVIAVGSMDWGFLPAYYTDYGSWVDITAPGGDQYLGERAGVLSTILCDNSMNYQDGRKSSSSYGYGFMQGTSMACPHVSGVAALGLAYASQLGKKFTASEYKALLLSSIYGIDQNFTGTKYAGNILLAMSDYKNKMGGGCVDALKLLLAIKGTPAIYVKTGEATTVDFARYFGGTASKIKLTGADIQKADLDKVGQNGVPNFSGTSMTFNCSKPGVMMMTLRATAGDTNISREFAIVSRPGLADNGGWL